MKQIFFDSTEKKVEFIELIYDLSFVYLIGKNNALLHHVEGGFFTLNTFIVYMLANLVALQVWYFSTLYINRYGQNSIRDYVYLFINMYLVYFLGDGITGDYSAKFAQYNVCWALILINTAVQYFMTYRDIKGTKPWEEAPIQVHICTLLLQAVIVLVSIPIAQKTGTFVSWVSLIVGVVSALAFEQLDFLIPMNSEHLTERIMLYMVFTFGETIISISEYFTSGFSLTALYYSVCAFLIATGLFLMYGLMYNRIIDRKRTHIGTLYMLIHVLLILSVNNITVAMEFMREEEVLLVPKLAFLVLSMVMYYVITYFLGLYSKKCYKAGLHYFSRMLLFSALFVILELVLKDSLQTGIAVSVIYVFAMLFMVVRRIFYVDSCEEVKQCTLNERKR